MQKIGRYEILEELGRGSMGAVFKAKDPQIGRIVAIKIILTANLPKEENDLYRSRFYREAQAAGQMSHPGIVTIHDIAEDESGQPYLVMEYVEGQTLHRLLRPDPHGKIVQRLPLEKTLELCAQVAEALHYAHLRSVVHRDIKPSNIMVTPDERAKIADFGIARLSGTEATHTASITGTPAYMSPEQFRGGTIDSRSDIFSLGSMLYWMATGEKAFPGDNVTQVSFNVVYREPAPPRHLVEDLPESVAIVLSRCLAKRPENRYQTAGEVAYDLRAILEGKLITATTAPPELTVEDTVDTIQSVTPVGKPLAAAEESAAGKQPAKAPARLSWTQVATLGGAAALAIGLWFWQQSKVSDAPAGANPASAQQTTQAATAAANAPAQSAANPGGAVPPATGPVAGAAPEAAKNDGAGQAAVAGGAPAKDAAPPEPAKNPASGKATGGEAAALPAPSAARGAAKKASLGTGSTLAIDCRHNFKNAEIRIQSGDVTILDGRLEGKTPGVRGGRLSQTFSLRPGTYEFVVRVVSEEDKYIQQEKIKGEFAQNQTQTLEITFGRRAGFGLGRDLTLKWKK